ncbi:hypothetical protein DFJ73DRAFT_957098 [Zopfochytrium polystomum]|nr:hypothetical protein DFJ73DRAFT_957098 [Zopfochytrium polystomum]
MADSSLARGNLRSSFYRYVASIRLILDSLLAGTEFDLKTPKPQLQTQSLQPVGDQSPYSPEPADGPFKHTVVKTPEDVQRLFGLAHLCDSYKSLTEIEDIVNGEATIDDLEADSDDEEEDEETAAVEDELFISSVIAGQCPSCAAAAKAQALNAGSATTEVAARAQAADEEEEETAVSGGAASFGWAQSAPTFSSRSDRGFRQARLTRPRSIRSTVRGSVRLSSIIMANVIESSPKRTISIDRSERESETDSISSSIAMEEAIARIEPLDTPPRQHSMPVGTPPVDDRPLLAPIAEAISPISEGRAPVLESSPQSPAASHSHVNLVSFATQITDPNSDAIDVAHDQVAVASLGARTTSSSPLPMHLVNPPSALLEPAPTPFRSPSPSPSRLRAPSPSPSSFSAMTVSRTVSVPLPPDYTPLIPLSPLIHRRTQLTASYSILSQQLQTLQASSRSANVNASTLQSLRKLLEDMAIVRTKLAAATQALGAASTTTCITEFSARQLAVNLTLMDWDVFHGRLEPRELASFAQQTADAANRSLQQISSNQQNPHAASITVSLVPPSLRAMLDQSIFLYRVVTSTVLSQEPTVSAALRSRRLLLWIQTAEILFALRSYNALTAVVEALTQPLVTRIDALWTGVSRKTMARLEDLKMAVSSLGNYHVYRGIVKRDSAAVQGPSGAAGTTGGIGGGAVGSSSGSGGGVMGSGAVGIGGGLRDAAGAAGPSSSIKFDGLIPCIHVLLDDLSRSGMHDATYFTTLLSQWELWSCAGESAEVGVSGSDPNIRGYASVRKERSDDVIHWILGQPFAPDETLLAWSLALQPTTPADGQGGGGGGGLHAVDPTRGGRSLSAVGARFAATSSKMMEKLSKLKIKGKRFGRSGGGGGGGGHRGFGGVGFFALTIQGLRSPGAYPLGYVGGDCVYFTPDPPAPQPADDVGSGNLLLLPPSSSSSSSSMRSSLPPSPSPYSRSPSMDRPPPHITSRSSSLAPQEEPNAAVAAPVPAPTPAASSSSPSPAPATTPPVATRHRGAATGGAVEEEEGGEDDRGCASAAATAAARWAAAGEDTADDAEEEEEGGALAAALAAAEEEAAIEKEFVELVERLEKLKREMM